MHGYFPVPTFPLSTHEAHSWCIVIIKYNSSCIISVSNYKVIQKTIMCHVYKSSPKAGPEVTTNKRFTRSKSITTQVTNETGPLPLCTFSVMGLSMCSSIFSESSPVRSKSGIINELSGFPNSVPTVRCGYTSSSWHGHTGHAYCICFVGKH